MGQVTIYLDDAVEHEMKEAAHSSHLSLSNWIARIIEEKIRAKWPQDIVNLAGSWKDDFPTLEEIRLKSPFDVPGIKTKATTSDILDAIRQSRSS